MRNARAAVASVIKECSIWELVLVNSPGTTTISSKRLECLEWVGGHLLVAVDITELVHAKSTDLWGCHRSSAAVYHNLRLFKARRWLVSQKYRSARPCKGERSCRMIQEARPIQSRWPRLWRVLWPLVNSKTLRRMDTVKRKRSRGRLSRNTALRIAMRTVLDNWKISGARAQRSSKNNN